MQTFQDTVTGQLWAFEDGVNPHDYPSTPTTLTTNIIEQPGPEYVWENGGWVVSPAKVEEIGDAVRAQRDAILSQTDWIVTKSLEAGQPVPQEWADYRQALRDIPTQSGFPLAVVWPVKPE
jgi:hypothetical protein